MCFSPISLQASVTVVFQSMVTGDVLMNSLTLANYPTSLELGVLLDKLG